MADEPQAEVDFSVWRQGDFFDLPSIAVLTDCGPIEHAAPLGVVVLTQTCDLVRCQGSVATVSPLIELTGDDERNAQNGTKPGFAAVPLAGERVFADLAHAGPVASSLLAAHKRTAGLDPDDLKQIRRFGESVARFFGRFAFPDEVVPWLNGLRDVVLSKHDSENSAEGELIRQCVAEFRVEAEGPNFWSRAPYEVTSIVVVKRGVLPEFEDPPPVSDHLARQIVKAKGAGDIAMLLQPLEVSATHSKDGGTSTGSHAADGLRAERWHLWQALAEAWAKKCRPTPTERAKPAVANALTGGQVSAELVTADTYTYERFRASEQLDVQHLSQSSLLSEE